MKFYPTDWRGDPALRLCSLAARGLWIEMLMIMHEARPRGFLLVNGRAPIDTQLALLAGAFPDQITELLGELESAQVFSRNRKSVIYSRRMVNDEKKSKVSRKNGKLGGNPSICNQKENTHQVNPEDKPPDKPQKPEVRGQMLEGIGEGVDIPNNPDIFIKHHQQIFDVAFLKNNRKCDLEKIDQWRKDGIDVVKDILPTIRKIHREQSAKGNVPGSLAYYDMAVRDANKNRLSNGSAKKTIDGKKLTIDEWCQTLSFDLVAGQFTTEFAKQHFRNNFPFGNGPMMPGCNAPPALQLALLKAWGQEIPDWLEKDR